jgi:hypothetical protein
MPKGNVTPKERMNQRFSLLQTELEKTPADYNTFTKVKRKVNEFLGSSDGQLVTTEKRMKLKRKLDKMAKNDKIKNKGMQP